MWIPKTPKKVVIKTQASKMNEKRATSHRLLLIASRRRRDDPPVMIPITVWVSNIKSTFLGLLLQMVTSRVCNLCADDVVFQHNCE